VLGPNERRTQLPNGPRAVAAAPGGMQLYVADMPDHCIWRCRAGEPPEVIAGRQGLQGGAVIAWPGEGCVGVEAALEYPHDLALSSDSSTLYVCELYCIRALDLTAQPPTLCTVYQSDYGLGGIALVPDGSCLIVALHSRHLLVEVSLLAEQSGAAPGEKAVAGTGEPGCLVSDDYALSSRLCNPTKLAVTACGDIAFVDSGNRALRLVERSTGLLRTLSGAIDAPDGLAMSPGGSVFVSEGRNFQVLQFRAGCAGLEWNWGTCAGTGFKELALPEEVQSQADRPVSQGSQWQGLPAQPSGTARPALEVPLGRPQGLCWLPGRGLLICNAGVGAVHLVRSLTPWTWHRRIILPRLLVEKSRAALVEEPHCCSLTLNGALLILMRLPDEEFREILSWWSER